MIVVKEIVRKHPLGPDATVSMQLACEVNGKKKKQSCLVHLVFNTLHSLDDMHRVAEDISGKTSSKVDCFQAPQHSSLTWSVPVVIHRCKQGKVPRKLSINVYGHVQNCDAGIILHDLIVDHVPSLKLPSSRQSCQQDDETMLKQMLIEYAQLEGIPIPPSMIPVTNHAKNVIVHGLSSEIPSAPSSQTDVQHVPFSNPSSDVPHFPSDGDKI